MYNVSTVFREYLVTESSLVLCRPNCQRSSQKKCRVDFSEFPFMLGVFLFMFYSFSGFFTGMDSHGGLNLETPSLNTPTVISHVFCKDLFNNLLTVFQTDKGACSILLPSQQA